MSARFARLSGAGAAMALVGGLASAPAHGFAIPVGGEFHVNSFTTDYQILPEVCGNDDGTFVVTWSSSYQDGYGFGVFGDLSASMTGKCGETAFTAADCTRCNSAANKLSCKQ